MREDRPPRDPFSPAASGAPASPPVFATVETTDLVRQIARQMRHAIVRGNLKPGERITELRLSREFGTSRAPVREAARLLESQGLVVSSPRRGFFVRELKADDLDNIYDLRICLEVHAGRSAIPRLGEDDLDRLEKQVEKMHRLAKTGPMEQQIFEDFTFHRMLLETAGNARLLKVYDEVASELAIGITLIGQLYDDPVRLAGTHDPIMVALRARDADLFGDEMRFHIAVAQDHVVDLCRQLENEALPATGR